MKDRNEIQQEAVKAWLSANKKGTFEIGTGVGKTISALHCLNSMPKNDGKVHVFLAETTEREKDLMNDIQKYKQLFNVDILKEYNLKFLTYQAAYRLQGYELGLVIADEIHFALSPEYFKFFKHNQYEAIVCLSATIDRNVEYVINNKIVTKGDMLDSIAPVCYTYTISQAKDDGIGRDINIYVVYSDLNDTTKNIKAGSQKRPFFQTEKQSYAYWDKEHTKSWFIEDAEMKTLKIRITANKRSKLLFELPHKVENAKKLLNVIQGKTLIFGNNLDSLLKVTNNVVSSRNDESRNNAIREHFEHGRIKTIGSFKQLLQGANIKELDNLIIMSYYSKSKDLVQRLGRLRKNQEKAGSAFIFVTRNTQEEVWFSKMIDGLTSFNFINCNNIDDAITKYLHNETKKT